MIRSTFVVGTWKCSSEQPWPGQEVQEVWLNLLQTAVFGNHAYGIAMKFLQRGGKKAAKNNV